jgi:pimeloyl-ACP methyl ester carboxylesterase
VLVHGLGCNESLWTFPAPHEGGDFGELLEQRCGYMPLYLRFNTGLRVSDNGKQLAGLLERFCAHHGAAVTQLLLIAHSMGGLVVRSACHLGSAAGQKWVSRVRHVVYLGAPHLGAPLEKATNVATHVLGLFDTTATRVIRDLLNTRSAGVKDLRFGNLVDQDWLDCDPDELMNNRRVPIPWLATARHHRVVGQALAGVATVGDAVVRPESAAGYAHGTQPGAPGASDVQVMPGLGHLTLARHPAVYEHIERWVKEDG